MFSSHENWHLIMSNSHILFSEFAFWVEFNLFVIFHCQQPFMDLLSGSMSNLVALWHPLLIAMHHPCSLQAIIPLQVVKRESVTIPLKLLYCQQHLTSHQHTGNKYENNILSFSVLLPSPFVKILSHSCLVLLPHPNLVLLNLRNKCYYDFPELASYENSFCCQ